MNVSLLPRVGRFASTAVCLVALHATALAQAPTIDGFSPSTISIGMPVTITGTNFTGNVTVRFGNVTGTNTVLTGTTQVTSVVPTSLANAPGNITVTTAGGTATSPTSYAVDLAPKINSFTPATAPVGRMITVSGYNFLGSAIANRTITVDGIGVPTFTVTSNRATFPVPVGATAGQIQIATNHGVAVSSGNIIIASGPPPSNDNFENPTILAGSSGSVTTHNTDATKQPSEGNHSGNPGGHSIWFQWTAPASRWYLFNPNLTSTNLPTLQAIYTGSELGALTTVGNGSPNNSTPRYSSAVPLNAVAGTTYRIALDGYNGYMGDVTLNWSELNPPTIAAVNPGTVFAGQIGTVSITGSGFTPIANVTVGGVTIPSNRTNITSSTALSISQIPLSATPGSGPVTVTTPVGTGSGGNIVITATPPPSIGGFSPASGNVGANVTITGTALALADNPVAVFFNGTPASSITVTTSGNISARVPSGATSGPITVSTIMGNATTTANFTVTSALPPPVINSFSPTSGAPGTSVTIEGANFSGATSVTFNGTAAAFATTSNTTLVATVPTGATTGPIAVTTSGGTATSATSFVVPPLPVITSISPTEITPTMSVTITGERFSNVFAVSIGGIFTGFTINSDTQITLRAPAGIPASGYIVVMNADGSATSPTPYTLLPAGMPQITSFSPASIAPSQTVTIYGSGFSDVTTVTFNGVATPNFTVVSPTLLFVTAPSNLSAGTITVQTTIGTATSSMPYTVSSAPVITGVTPPSGPVNRVITVNGANFTTPITVRVNGTSIGAFSRGNTTLTFAVPAGATTGPITVQTSNGTATSPFDFVVTSGPAPINDAFANPVIITGTNGAYSGNTANATKEPGEPNHADNSGGASVWFSWTAPSSGLYLFNPYNSSSLQFGIIQSIYTGNALGALTRVASGLTPTNVFARYGSAAVLDAIAGTTYRIALDGYNGVMADYRLTWAPLGPPTIHNVNPTSGTAGQTSPTINISGNNFTPGAIVAFNGTPVAANRVTYSSPFSITVTQVPVGATTGPITVTTPAGTATSPFSFTIGAPPPPVITGFSPSGAKVGTPVNINGANFGGTTAVLFNGTASSFAVTGNNTLITTSVPAGASSGPITVVTPNGQAVSSTPFVVVVPPIIIDQPQSQTVVAFSNVTFSVTAQSNGPEEYYWTKNGVGIFGADTRTLTLSNVTTADAGDYVCVVVNNAGRASSNPATLTVTKAPATITLHGLTATYDGTLKSATATTEPAGLFHAIVYEGGIPLNAGSYGVTATIHDPNYAGSATGTLTIQPAPATIALSNLAQRYDGTPRLVTTTSLPADLPVTVTYSDSANAPVYPGSYAVAATIANPNYSGSTAGTLVVSTAALVRHAPTLAGDFDGSLQVALPENVTLNGNTLVSGDLLVPGTPVVQLNGGPTYGSTLDGPGATDPTGHAITLNGSSVLRHVVRRIDAPALPAVTAPQTPAGTRDVVLTSSTQSPGDFATLRDLTLSGNAGNLALPPGAYRDITINGDNSLTLGIPGATTPVAYDLRRLTLNGNSRVHIAGPVALTVGENVLVNGAIGEAATAAHLTLSIASGGLTLNADAVFAGTVIAPTGSVTLYSATLIGSVIADRLTLNGSAVVEDPVD